MKTYRPMIGMLALGALCMTGACNRGAPSKAASAENESVTADHTAKLQRERDDAVAELQKRIVKIEEHYAQASDKVASGKRVATTGLREELKEDMTNVKEAVQGLGSTTPENWWNRQEQAMTRTADDVEADVHRMAGNIIPPRTETATGTAGTDVDTAPFTSRRDRFVTDLRARVEAMENALDKVKARGAKDTELEDTRARVKKLQEDIDHLTSASADDWWDLSKARVTDYVDRVEASVDRLDDDKPRK